MYKLLLCACFLRLCTFHKGAVAAACFDNAADGGNMYNNTVYHAIGVAIGVVRKVNSDTHKCILELVCELLLAVTPCLFTSDLDSGRCIGSVFNCRHNN